MANLHDLIETMEGERRDGALQVLDAISRPMQVREIEAWLRGGRSLPFQGGKARQHVEAHPRHRTDRRRTWLSGPTAPHAGNGCGNSTFRSNRYAGDACLASCLPTPSTTSLRSAMAGLHSPTMRVSPAIALDATARRPHAEPKREPRGRLNQDEVAMPMATRLTLRTLGRRMGHVQEAAMAIIYLIKNLVFLLFLAMVYAAIIVGPPLAAAFSIAKVLNLGPVLAALLTLASALAWWIFLGLTAERWKRNR